MINHLKFKHWIPLTKREIVLISMINSVTEDSTEKVEEKRFLPNKSSMSFIQFWSSDLVDRKMMHLTSRIQWSEGCWSSSERKQRYSEVTCSDKHWCFTHSLNYSKGRCIHNASDIFSILRLNLKTTTNISMSEWTDDLFDCLETAE